MPRTFTNEPDEDHELDLDNLDAMEEEKSIRDELDAVDEDEDVVDEDVKDILADSQNLAYGRQELLRKLKEHTANNPDLSGDDIDAAWDYADVGEETVGGQNPTPDQSVVDDEGKAVGLTYQDNEQLGVDKKIGDRDQHPWELNAASSPDYAERVKEEFHEPLETLGIKPEKGKQRLPANREAKKRAASATGRTPTRAAAQRKTSRRRAKASRSTGATRAAKGRATGRRTTKASSKSKSGTRQVSSAHRGTRR